MVTFVSLTVTSSVSLLPARPMIVCPKPVVVLNVKLSMRMPALVMKMMSIPPPWLIWMIDQAKGAPLMVPSTPPLDHSAVAVRCAGAVCAMIVRSAVMWVSLTVTVAPLFGNPSRLIVPNVMPPIVPLAEPVPTVTPAAFRISTDVIRRPEVGAKVIS
jgi:hypothetical protein